MPELRCYLLGRFRAQIDDQPITGLEAGKTQELLCYLLLHRDRAHAREALAGLLWGDHLTSRSKKYLRQALWQIQSALPAATGKEDALRLLEVDPGWVRLVSTPELWLDVAVLEQGFANVQNVAGRDLDDPSFVAVREMVELYQGDLLEGLYTDWCLYDRERLQHMYLVLLDKLMAASETRSMFEVGLQFGASILRIDPARETTHRRLMRLHYLAGDRTGALRQYERCENSLAAELGVGPAESTTALYEQIRTNRPLGTLAAPGLGSPDPGPDAEPSSLVDVMHLLQRLRSTLSELQHQVQHDIQTVELTLEQQP